MGKNYALKKSCKFHKYLQTTCTLLFFTCFLQEQSNEVDQASIALKDEVNSLKEQIKNLKDVCCCNGEDFQTQLNLINDLKVEVEYWKSNYIFI